VDSTEDLALQVPQMSIFMERPLSDNTVHIGMAMALLHLVLDVPIMFLTKMCKGTSSSVQSFWSGVGVFLVGIGTCFFDSKTSIFSGYYSTYEFCMMLLISICFIMITLLQTQATKFISTPALNVIR
jgi:hypothetical protein